MAAPTRTGVQFLIFSLALPVAVVSSWIGASVAFGLYGLLPYETQRADWTGPVLNQFAPGLAGLVVVAALVKILRKRNMLGPTLTEHLARTSLWYILAGLIVWLNYMNRGIEDFGLWSQAINWPLVAVLVGVVYDLTIVVFVRLFRRIPSAV